MRQQHYLQVPAFLQVLVGKENSMVKKIKSIISGLLLASMIFTFVPAAYADDISGWNLNCAGGAQATMSIDHKTVYRGNGSMKITNASKPVGKVYAMITTQFDAKEGRRYRIGGKVKSNNSTYLQFMVDWEKRYDLMSFGKTYDWTNYEFIYTAKTTKRATFQILCEGTTDGAWVDDIECIDLQTNENLFTNSTFDTDDVTGDAGDDVVGDIDYTKYENIYNSIKTSDTFSVSDMNSVIGAFKYIPVYQAENIKIDGDLSEWENAMSISVPTLSSQYQVYMNDDRKKDLQATCKYLYDDKNLYLSIDVLDDKFATSPTYYWSGDSIQIAVSAMNEKYGTEIGFAYDPQSGEGKVYSDALSKSQRAKIACVVKQKGTRTIYEISIPWVIKWNERPDEILFDLLINDNDGDGRRYCAEMAPGISEGKTNAVFPKLEMVDNQKDWYSWIEGPRTVTVNTEAVFNYYVVNTGTEKLFTIKNKEDGTEETVTIPAGMGIRREFKKTYDTVEKRQIGIECVADNAGSIDSEFELDVQNLPITKEYAEGVVKKLSEETKTIEKLLSECKSKGITTDYEMINYRILERFTTYVQEDIDINFLSRVYYHESATDKIYNETKEALEAYLSGERKPKSVPRYVTSDLRFDGESVIGTMEENGKREERPLFLIGYGHGSYQAPTRKDIPIFQEFGVNSIQTEFGITSVMKTAYCDFSNWYARASQNNISYRISVSNNEKHSGNSAMKIIFNDKQRPQRYATLWQTVPVEPGKQYVFKGYAKADRANNVTISAEDYENRIQLDGTYDWKEFTKEYSAPPNVTSTTIRIIAEGFTDGIYLDDWTFCEKGTDNNLLKNGDFENTNAEGNVLELTGDDRYLNDLLDSLKSAEDNNIAVDLLMSPHYFPTDFVNVHPDAKYIGYRYDENQWITFNEFNVNAPSTRKAVEEYLRYVIPKIKQYKSVKSICMTNEPEFHPECCGDYYLNDWHKFLQEKYGTIEELNTAYQSNYETFYDVSLIMDENKPANVCDYVAFNDKIFSSWNKFIADIIHELAPEIPVYAKIEQYLNYNLEYKYVLYAGEGYENYYEFCDLNGCDAGTSIDRADQPVSKNMWYDYLRSMKTAPIINGEDHIIRNGNEYFEPEVADFCAQDAFEGAIHGRAMTNIWIWDRSIDQSDQRAGSVLFRPDVISKINQTALDVNRLSYEITALQKEKPEVAVLYSNESIINDDTAMNALYEGYQAAVYNGQDVRFVLNQQLEKINDYKLVIIPNVKYVQEKTLYAIKDYIDNGGNVLIMGEDTLGKNEKNLDNNKELVNYIYEHSTVTPFESNTVKIIKPTAEELLNTVGDLCSKIGIQYVSVKDAKTGERVNNVAYTKTIYNGKMLINLINYSDTKDVQIFVNGKMMDSAVELRSGDNVGNTVTLEKFNPVILEANVENPFFDTYGSWAEGDIVKLSGKGIAKGESESRFNPNGTMTRAEFLAFLMRGINADTSAVYQNGISDVASDKWYAKTVQSAAAMGIINTNTAFRPDVPITREEMCDMLVKCYEAQNGTVNYTQAAFDDVSGSSYSDSISKAVALNLMVGRENNKFVPLGNATRAEGAAVISRYLK